MIRANDSGLATPPPEVVDDAKPRKGLLTPRNIIILVGALAWIAVVFLFVIPQFTKKPAQAGASAAATAAEAKPAAAEEAAPSGAVGVPKAVPAPQLTIANRVFNLAGTTAGFKYVKLSLTIQFENDKGTFAKAKGEALKKLEDEFTADNAGTLGAFNDILTTSVSSKTAAELATTKGKEDLRAELISKFNRALIAGGSKDRVTYVDFSDFVMQ